MAVRFAPRARSIKRPMRLPDRKTVRQAYLRIMRHPGSPRRTGRGVAVGLFVAFIVPFTFHMALALALAVLFRGARFAAMCATWVNNPLTFSIIYPLQCYVGGYLIGRPLSYETVSSLVSEVVHSPSWHAFLAIGKEFVVPFFAGGVLFGSVAAVIGYHLSIYLLTRFRARKEERKKERERRRGIIKNHQRGENQ